MAILSLGQHILGAAIHLYAYHLEGGGPAALAAVVPALVFEYSLQWIGSLIMQSLYAVRP